MPNDNNQRKGGQNKQVQQGQPGQNPDRDMQGNQNNANVGGQDRDMNRDKQQPGGKQQGMQEQSGNRQPQSNQGQRQGPQGQPGKGFDDDNDNGARDVDEDTITQRNPAQRDGGR